MIFISGTFMSNKIRQLMESGIPFLILGISIAFIFAMLIFFSYILIWGIIIGSILGLISWIKYRFFSSKPQKTHKGRIIEHDDEK